MKRTGEISLGIIGIVLSFLMSLIGIFFIWAANTPDLYEVLDEIAAEAMLTADDINEILTSLPVIGTTVIIASGIGVIFGLVAVFCIKGNKTPKLAGTMFIIGSLLVGIITLGFGFLPGLLFLIAGIMSFARKPPIGFENTH